MSVFESADGLGTADFATDAVIGMAKGKTCERPELYQVANAVTTSPKTMSPHHVVNPWAKYYSPCMDRFGSTDAQLCPTLAHNI